MATLTIRPNANGTYNQWAIQFPASGSHYDKVDEASTDEDTTYIASADTEGTGKRDIFALPASGLTTETIDQVEVFFRGREESGASGTRQIGTEVRTNSANYTGAWNNQTTSYADFSTVYTTNPQSGVAWTIAEVDALEAGVRTRFISATAVLRVTQCWAVVTYTAGAGWAHKFNGVDNANISKINGVAIANINKVNGVA